MHQEYLVGSNPRVSDAKDLVWTSEFVFLISFQVMLMLSSRVNL
jgi:hypothetical protein